ncbi:MAG: hypothetical protein V7720_01600 [Halioglobus sp.]
MKGKFSASENLRGELNKLISETQKDKRASLMGGGVVRRRMKKKTNEKKGVTPLAGLIDKRIPLRAWYKGYEYRAGLLKNGTISFDGEKYATPTSAAKVITTRNVNGWGFWHYKHSSGDWVRLGNLRK